MENIEYLIDGAHGIYVPQIFVKAYALYNWGITDADAEILLYGPDHADYRDTWDSVLQSARYTAEDGRVYSLHQDGDLFAVAYGALTDDEYREFFGEDRH